MTSEAELTGLLERLVEKAQARGAAQAEAFAEETHGHALRIEHGDVTNASAEREFGVAVRVVDDAGRAGFAFATSEADADRAVATALDAARVLPGVDGFRFPEAGGFETPPDLYDARVLDFTPDEGVDACGRMIDAATDAAPGMTVAGGGLAWGEERVALANSNGVSGAYAGTRVSAHVSGVLREGGDTTTGFEFALSRSMDVDFPALGREAGTLAVRSRDAKPLPSGETTVLFRPTALDGLMEVLFLNAVLAESTASGSSVYAEKLGERVMPADHGIVDDGLLPGGWRSAPFDDEGVPAATTPIVEDGVLRTFLDDARGAAKRGASATGSAMRAERLGGRSYRAPPKATGLNVRFTGPTRSFDDLVGDVENGVLVYDAMGAHTANAASGDFSVNASTLFAIEDGEVTHAGKPAMISGNLPAALKGLAGLADDARDVGGGFSPAGFRLPTVRLDGIRVTTS